MFKEVYPSDFTSLALERATQKIPFQRSAKIAIEEMSKEIILLKDNTYFYSWSKKGKPTYLFHVSFLEKKLIVHHFLSLLPNQEQESAYRVLLHLAKTYRSEKIILKTTTQFVEIEEELREQDYEFVEGLGYVVEVVYRTGLVLGGGGAKGAYQIGVWHALEELGVEYQMISGTSVGALNGSLILQGDLKVAEEMWQTITTDKILSVSEQVRKDEYTVNQLLQDWQELTKLAIQSKGVSTKPLQELIQRLMIPEVIFSKDIDFYVVTTETPSMEEKVVALNEMTEAEFPLWLLASSSFYPAMEPCLINGTYYIDGGYRNNIPKDVLVDRGATEIIVVDVSGPGLSKSFKLPNNVVETTLKSPWGLGSMLLFDGNRSSWNMVLGYLEMMKIFGHFTGNNYTFKKEGFKKEIFKLSRDFLHFLRDTPKFNDWYENKTSLKTWEWLQKNNQRPETISLVLLESLGKKMNIPPTEVYSVASFSDMIQTKWQNKEEGIEKYLSENMLKSISEWLLSYMKQKSPITDYQLLTYYYECFDEETTKNKELFPLLMEMSWMSGIEALFLLFLEKRKS